MEMYTYPITVGREGHKYWAYSEDFPGVYGLGNTMGEGGLPPIQHQTAVSSAARRWKISM